MAKKGVGIIPGNSCPVCQETQQVNYIIREKHWYCMKCDTEFDREGVIYVYDDRGELIELIADKPNFWEDFKVGKGKGKLILTTTG